MFWDFLGQSKKLMCTPVRILYPWVTLCLKQCVTTVSEILSQLSSPRGGRGSQGPWPGEEACGARGLLAGSGFCGEGWGKVIGKPALQGHGGTVFGAVAGAGSSKCPHTDPRKWHSLSLQQSPCSAFDRECLTSCSL